MTQGDAPRSRDRDVAPGTVGPPPPPVLVDGTRRLSVEEVDRWAAIVAAGLAARGVRPGQAVAFQLPNWWETVVLLHACWRLGAVAAPLHHRLGAAEVAALLARLEPVVTLVADGLEAPPRAVVVRGPDDGFHELATHGEAPQHHGRSGDVAVALATSGSTGRPKLVRHARGALAYKARAMVEAHGLRASDVVLMPAPLAHISGLLNGVLLPGQAGMTTVLLERWDPEQALDLIARERVSFMIGPPTFFVDLVAARQSPVQTIPLRLISCGGATVTAAFVRETREQLGAWVKRTYGSTEAPTVTTWHEGDPPDRAAETDGRPVGSAELRVVDPEGRTELPPGGAGEILVRGPELFVGYDDPAATDAALEDDGWFRTGDVGRIDDAGWLTVVGRRDDVIVRGGENISPAEVEAVCATLPGVLQAVAVGYPDPRLGQRVGLVVAGDAPTVEEVQRHCAAAGLAAFKTPDRVLRVDDIPVLAAGKPDRSGLARRLTEERS